MKWQVDFFLHCNGMEFPDKRNFGEWTAVSPEDAIEQVLEASFKNATKADREYIRGCLSARPVGAFPKTHAPRTDDVILVKKADIPKMARILLERIHQPPEGLEQECWDEHGHLFIEDVKVMLGINEDEKF